MAVGGFTLFEWLMLIQHELLLFAGVFFLLGAADEMLVDFLWIWLKLTGRARTQKLLPDAQSPVHTGILDQSLIGPAAIFVPAWREAGVIDATIAHMLAVWPYQSMRLYIGCYRNDPATIAAAMAAADGDPRLRLVVHDRDGPSTKADCLNRLYHALDEDEWRSYSKTRMVVLHDAEDMVDPAGLGLLDAAISSSELVQLPVLPLPQANSPWIGSHYCEEFAEAHGKAMVVRDALRVGMPLAGVGCAIGREALDVLARSKPDGAPFSADCLTEDYELGLGISELGGRARFIRSRHANGELVATRAYFPARLDEAVRQKTRWVHGIALQGWDRLGWRGSVAEGWWRLRDRRGPFTAVVLAVAYLLLILATISWAMELAGRGDPLQLSTTIRFILALNFASFGWRGAWRFAFTAREYGWVEGVRAVLRIPVTNIIAIMSGRRALFAYIRSLRGHLPQWDKTHHYAHPARVIASSGQLTP